MSDFSLYVVASARRRTGALFVNILLLGIPDLVMHVLGVEKSGFLSPITVFLIFLFCVFPESPGNRLLNVAVLTDRKIPIGTKLRVYRVLPYLLFFALPIIGELFETKASKLTIGGALMLVLIFMAANAVAMFFSPDSRSLLDMKLGTRVFNLPTLPGQERAKMF